MVLLTIIKIFSRPPVIRVSDKVMIPQEEHPEINFVGLLIGPRGNTLKSRKKNILFYSSYIIFLIYSNGKRDRSQDYNSR